MSEGGEKESERETDRQSGRQTESFSITEFLEAV